MELTTTQLYTYVIIGQIIIGALLGLIPLFVGRSRGNARLGKYGFLATLIAGLLSPLAAIIAAVISVWMIVKKTAASNNGSKESDPA
ncbi:MAG: hypothetical protein WBC19_07980 [Pyrinomonadaceae bacterium]|nr:hypothetical protein [Chloracidobacterium sp.]MBP7416725.1 hypothetical protein [Pyrinomonadaceae bacterium]